MGSGKLKDNKETDGKESRDLKKRTKIGKLDTIRISTVDQLKFTSEKASESLTTFLNLKDGDKNPIATEEEPKNYKPLMTQKARMREDAISEEKKSAQFDHTKISQQTFTGTMNSRQVLI